MSKHELAVGILLGIAVLVTWLSILGMVVMRDAYQKLHYTAPVVSIAALAIAAAVWVQEGDWQARIKSSLAFIVLFFTNSILAHATARAQRVREAGRLEIEPGKKEAA